MLHFFNINPLKCYFACDLILIMKPETKFLLNCVVLFILYIKNTRFIEEKNIAKKPIKFAKKMYISNHDTHDALFRNVKPINCGLCEDGRKKNWNERNSVIRRSRSDWQWMNCIPNGLADFYGYEIPLYYLLVFRALSTAFNFSFVAIAIFACHCFRLFVLFRDCNSWPNGFW